MFRIFLNVFLLKDADQPIQSQQPRFLTSGEETMVLDSVRQEKQEVEKLLKRKKELILREEEEEVQQPKKEFSALDRLSQQENYQLSLPEPERVPRFATKDWGKPGDVEDHKKIVLAWCVGSLLFASLLGFIFVTWRCCSKRKADDPSPLEFVRGFFALLCRRRKKEASNSAECDAQNSVELEPLQ